MSVLCVFFVLLGCLTTHDAVSNGVPIVTLPLEHVRGRYTLGMYQQMGLSELIARNTSHYISLVQALVTDSEYQLRMSRDISAAYLTRYHKNWLVAQEWVNFIARIA